MSDNEIELLKEEKCGGNNKSFLKGISGILSILAIGIPIILFIVSLISQFQPEEEKIQIGMSLANTIALIAAGAAITGTLYSNHQNEKRNEQQICEAGNRLTRQLNNQNINLKKQFENQKENINEQLIAADERLEKQLESQKEDLKTQLIFDKQQPNIHRIHKNLKVNMEIFNNPDQFSNQDVADARRNLYMSLLRIKGDIETLYYLPEDIINNIISSTQFIENKLKENNLNIEDMTYTQNMPKFIKLFVDEGEEFQDYINELIILVEKETGIKIDR